PHKKKEKHPTRHKSQKSARAFLQQNKRTNYKKKKSYSFLPRILQSFICCFEKFFSSPQLAP
ncbi:hypothetical protein M3J43_26040, partial [Escherichia coli]|nr:hypothetical protein [Escherichia coli]